jgi:hypothetical protein
MLRNIYESKTNKVSALATGKYKYRILAYRNGNFMIN